MGVQKKDVKDSPPVARRSRRSRDPNLDDSLEIDKSSIPINQTKPSTEKIEASPGNQSEKMEETSKTRRSRKRNLSTSDSNTSQNLETAKSAVLQEIIDVTDDEEMAKADDADDISILEVEDSNDVQSDSTNELLDSAEASNIESNDTRPVRGKKRGRK